MSLFKRHATITGADQLIPRRPTLSGGALAVTNDTALRHSAVWACLRLRANLISTMPVDVYRKVEGRQIEMSKPPVLVNPGGERVDILEWLYSSQVDLDRAGNDVGIITARDGRNLPARIDLVPISEVVVRVRKGELWKYKISGKDYEPEDIWHEKQYTLPGLHVGLSPIAYAAWSIGEYLSVQDFAIDWFSNGTIPKAKLKNTAKVIDPKQADAIKERYKATMANGDLFVHGADWDYEMIQAKASETNWIEAKQYSAVDIARFFDCPADLIDAAVSGSSITYANITQRNLQLLIMHLGPAIVRREAALSRLTSSPRFVKLNSNALLRMDPTARAETLGKQVAARLMAPSEAREIEDRAPFTEEQMAEFDRLFGPPKSTPQMTNTGGSPS